MTHDDDWMKRLRALAWRFGLLEDLESLDALELWGLYLYLRGLADE